MRSSISCNDCRGVSLVELIVFLVVIAIALGATVSVFTQSLYSANDPLIRTRALELAQAQLDEVLARKFAENTPTGGVPACGSLDSPSPCTGFATSDADFDDVGDFAGFVDNTTYPGYSISVSIANAGGELGITADQARRITVVVSTPPISGAPSGTSVTLSAYRVNF